MVEIKPSKQTLGEAKSMQDKAMAVVNAAKWEAARAWCKAHQMGFRVITENEIFNKPQNSKRKKRR
jgi:ketol-acid reductoisomerase